MNAAPFKALGHEDYTYGGVQDIEGYEFCFNGFRGMQITESTVTASARGEAVL